jgi:hypothetical protein
MANVAWFLLNSSEGCLCGRHNSLNQQ